MQVFLIIGERGCGKSTLAEERVKQFLQNNPVENFHVYDIERRYFPDRPLPHIKEFMERLTTLKNCFFLFEEATIFFPNRGRDPNLVHALVTSRYNGNTCFLIYHSICAVPYYVYDLTNCIILFSTKDEENRVIGKYEDLHPYWKKIKTSPQDCPQFKLKNGNYSPYQIIKL